MNRYVTRPFVQSDRTAAETLIADMYDFESSITPGRRPWKECRDDFREWFDKQQKNENSFAFVATQGSEIIGICIGQIEGNRYPALKPEEWRHGYVDELVVARTHRRQGVGRTLWQTASDFCASRGIVRMRVTALSDNSDAQAFYQSVGLRSYLVTFRGEIVSK